MDKKQLMIRLVMAVFIIPLALAFLANLLGLYPGTVGGITMIGGVAYFIYWAKTNRTADHNEQPGTKP